MTNIIDVQKKIIPQAIEQMKKRYLILRQISIDEPIGRRNLSSILDISERIARSEVDFLKDQGLVDISTTGVTITESGKTILEDLEIVMNDIMGISDLEKRLKEKLGIKYVAISKGVSDTEDILKAVAKRAARYLLDNIEANDKIAIAGGNTMREIALSINTQNKYEGVTALPTRGSVGADIDIQANSVAALLAKNLGSKVEFLYVPDDLDGSARESLMSVPDIKKTIDDLKLSNKIFFSVGRADVMSKRRGMKDEDIKFLSDNGAIGEAFGYYFDKDGKVVLKLNTCGVDIDMFKASKNSVVVFAGNDKVDAFLALHKINKNISLITDEQSAKEILAKYAKN